MKINVSKIPEGGMNLRFEKDGEWFRQRIPEKGPFDFAPDRIDVVCDVRRINENVFIEGSISSAGDVPCCRCLETTRLPIRSAFKYTFAPAPSRQQEDLELTATDLDFEYYQEDVIDLDRLIFEQMLLQIPIKPLCSESCRGLCPQCGANLNKTECGCRNEVRDERFAALKQFNVKR